MFEELKEIVVMKLDLDPDAITPDKDFKEDLGIDSLDLFDLVMYMEDKYDIEIPSEDLENIHTVGQMEKYMKERVSLR